MNGRERTQRILERKPTDRIGLYEHFWGDTRKDWIEKGHIKENESLDDHFGYDMTMCGPFSFVADMDYKPEIVAETEDTITMRDGNYAVLKRHKHHDTTPEHIDFLIDGREIWEERIKPLLVPSERRINFEAYRNAKQAAAEAGRFFLWCGVQVFECIHPVTGHMNFLMAMIEDPDWVKDMCDTYAKLTLGLQEMLFDKEGCPDGIWYYEDMGFKGAPFMSPDMYKEFIFPSHKKCFDYAKSKNMPVIVHSCGFVEAFVPGLIEAGMDCLQVIEVKAGMDLLKLNRMYGDKISFMGGIDVRALYSNDKEVIDRELLSKIPEMKKTNNFFLHSDHSIPKTVEYETYKYFIEKAMSI